MPIKKEEKIMTEEEKKQLREDIKSGKVDIYELYEKYGLHEPSFISYEAWQEKEGNKDKTIKEYEKDIEESRINFLIAHMR